MRKSMCFVALVCCGASRLLGLPIEVTTHLDVQDASLTATIEDLVNGATGPDGLISLREAVQAANVTPGQDVIYFSPDVTEPIRLGTGGSTSELWLTDNSGGTTITGDGIVIDGGAFQVTEAGLRIVSGENVIVGLTIVRCPLAGICLDGVNATANVIAGCHIGILNGAAAPNRFGIEIRNGANGNIIGAGGIEFPNVISGNQEAGIFIYGEGTENNSVVGNFIGTNEGGAQAVPNGLNGVTIGYGACSNVVGGLLPEMRNVISGNTRSGVFLIDNNPGIVTRNNVIWGNDIGLTADGQAALGNGFWGIYMGGGPTGNFVGGATEGAGNRIAYNGRDGIELNGAATRENRILGNRIFMNQEKTIDLVAGANGGIQPPVITGVNPVRGTAGQPNAVVEVFADPDDEAWDFLGRTTADEGGAFVLDPYILVSGGGNILATVTDVAGNTSALSAPFPISETPGEGEGEEPPLTPWVTVAITEANDLCRVYLNGELAVETAWGEGPGGIEIGNQPGYSGEVDITQALRVGNNTFRFVVWNAEGCCAVSGFFQVKVNGVTVYNNGIERADSTEGVKFFDTYSLLWDLTKADLIVEAQDAVTQARLPFAVVRVDPGGHTARLADNGLHRFLLDRPGAYTATAFAAGYEPETAPPLVFGADSVYATVVFFMTPQAGGSPDSDGDGLPDWDEINLHGTNPDNPDTDGDGMSDLFEVQYGLDPTLDDAYEDLDGDGFTNLREFFLRSDPTDPSDPRADFYVSLAGNNANAGTRDAPWRTLQYAIDAVGELVGDAVGRAEPARLRLLADGTLASVIAEAGTYQEDVALRPGIRVEGASLGQTIIQGRVTGAPHSALVRVRVQEPAAGATPLVRVSNSAMLLDRVTLRGRTSSLATGVLFEGEDTGGTLMTDCVLVQLRTGLDIHGAVPLVRRTRFSDISGDAIVLRAISAKQGEENTLGTANDSGSGWNRFENIGGKVVVNERGTEIRVEDNDWDTDDPAEIAELVEGPVDYEPFLPKGGGLLPASIICAVWEAATNMPVTNAALSIAPGGITPVTDNVDGVYVFAALPAGTYTVTVNAPGFDAMGTATTVSGGQTASLVFALGAEKAQPPPDGCGCFKAADASGPALSAQAGNVLVLVLAVAAALSRRRRAARASRP